MEYNLADLFESVADAVPERTALVCDPRRLSYAQLDERANRLAQHLRRAGIGAGDHIGVHLYNSTEYVECLLAAFKIRAVPLNVNYRYVAAELRRLLHDADVVALLHQRELGPRVSEVAGDLPGLRHLLTVDDGSDAPLPDGAVAYEAALMAEPGERDFPSRSGDDLHIIYTGGTTGVPKGVMWRQEDLFFSGMGGGNPIGDPVGRPEEVAENALASPPMVMFPVAPLMHGAAQLATFIGFHRGGTVVLVRHFDAGEVWRLVEHERVTTMSIVGDAMARPLADRIAAGPPVDTSSLMIISSAGAILSAAVRDQIGRLLPSVFLVDSFGASETGFQGMGTAGCSPDSGLTFRMNERTCVVDDELRPVAAGSPVVGRLALRGRVPLGYYNDAVKTAEVFASHDGTRWVVPGDLATANADGTITVLGRGSTCINSGGEKVFPEEVEAALKSHPEVFDAVVVGVADERWGESVTAVVAPRAGSAPTLAELVAHCEPRLARYKLPRRLVSVDAVLRSPSGKPDYGWARLVAAGVRPESPAPAVPQPG